MLWNRAHLGRHGDRAMTTVLVTGGAGYIGSHACMRLAEAGYRPVTYDNLSRGFERAVQWGPLERGDVLDEDRLDAVLRTHAPAAVMHFAAFAAVGESVADPLLYYRNNLAGTVSLLRAMRRAGIGTLVFSSTCAIFGQPERQPMNEETPRAPINPYGATKLAAETLLADCEGAHGLRSMRLRYFNAAGADPEARIGEAHEPETHLIPLVLRTAAGERPMVEIYGDDYPTPDGTAVRDYVHVLDLADAHILALRHLLDGGSSGAYNLGTGHGYSVREVIAACEAAVGKSLPRRAVARRPGDPALLVADSRAIERAFGWTPRHSDLESIVGDAWRWHRKLRGI